MDFIFNYILTNQHIFYFPILCYFSVKYFNESYRLRQTINLHHSSENEEPDLIKPVRNLIANLDNKKSLIKVALQELLELTHPDVVVAGLLLKNQNQFQVEQIYNIENKLLSESLSNIITEKFVNLEFSEISKLFGYQYIPEKYKKNLEIFGINLTYTFPVYDQRHGLIGAI
ncbi:MAG: hypothetical protein KBC84_05320, partial [Proteobacteria bacterium]|nr:hypothetical protein [Pseudomonadota bacterium]